MGGGGIKHFEKQSLKTLTIVFIFMKPAQTILIYFGSEISHRETPFLSSLKAIGRAEVESSLPIRFVLILTLLTVIEKTYSTIGS